MVDETKYNSFLAILEGTDDTYTKLATEPADWETNYTDYYTKNSSTGEYEAVTGETAPTFEANKYYSKTAGTNSRLPSIEEVMAHFAEG